MSRITDLWARWRENEDKERALEASTKEGLSLARKLENEIIEGAITCRDDLIVKLKLLQDIVQCDGCSKEELILGGVISSLQKEIPMTPACKQSVIGTQNYSPKELFHV